MKKISVRIQNVVNELTKQGTMFFKDGVSESQICLFESEKSVVIPTQYREWLQFSDGGELFLPAGVQLYGVAHKPLIEPHENNSTEKTDYVIGRLSNGDPILCNSDSSSIKIFNEEAGKIEDDEVFLDFFTFIADLHLVLGVGGT